MSRHSTEVTILTHSNHYFVTSPDRIFCFLVVTVGCKMILGEFHQIISVSDWYWFFSHRHKFAEKGGRWKNKGGPGLNLYTLQGQLAPGKGSLGQEREKCEEWDSSHSRQGAIFASPILSKEAQSTMLYGCAELNSVKELPLLEIYRIWQVPDSHISHKSEYQSTNQTSKEPLETLFP